MKLVVGLGNIGEKYENTRHNVGFLVAEKLADNRSFAKSKGAPLTYTWIVLGDEKIEIIKPTTFMNKSGEAVVGPLRKHDDLRVEDIYVVHDDLDIRMGEWKIDFGKGPKDHKGILSVEGALKSKDFWRVRVGVDGREPENRIPGEDYVLMKLKKDEVKLMEEVIEEVVFALRGKLA